MTAESPRGVTDPGGDLPTWRDEGLAVERTALSYVRSVLSLGALALLTLRVAILDGLWLLPLAILVIVAIAMLASWRTGRAGYRGRSHGHDAAPAQRTFALLTVSIALAGVLVALLVATSNV